VLMNPVFQKQKLTPGRIGDLHIDDWVKSGVMIGPSSGITQLIISVVPITFRASPTIEYTKAINIYGFWHAYYLIISVFCYISI